uniref:Uncharacterized protein n=1 Tax=Anguilla anguilla TaxID=7936 RepID=A0A0E9TLB1_ANGAN
MSVSAANNPVASTKVEWETFSLIYKIQIFVMEFLSDSRMLIFFHCTLMEL